MLCNEYRNVIQVYLGFLKQNENIIHSTDLLMNKTIKSYISLIKLIELFLSIFVKSKLNIYIL